MFAQRKTQIFVVLISETFKVTTVTLLLQRATSVDSGSYTCRLQSKMHKNHPQIKQYSAEGIQT